MIKYKAQWFARPVISRVEVIRETPTQVVLERRREAKEGDFFFYSDTYDGAKDWLLAKCLKIKVDAEEAIKRQKHNMDRADVQFDKISKFKEE